ncbi:MAG: type III pantothenate kinase [Candidatus Margulisbacteria bacterium]|nr:type III pantothenate kinase [Candidatus Margulisiibacteriota bacterium]
MILAIDLGNTNIVIGLFSNKKLLCQWRWPTSKLKLPKIKAKLEKVIVASVVPAMNGKLKKAIKKQYNCNAFFVTAQNIPGLKVKLKNKQEIGADRVVDALAAYTLYKGPLVIVDFGTATTFDAISAKGEYLGGAIAPGVILARDALYEQAAKLPKIEIKPPKNIIGKNTVAAMRSGLVYGYVAMVEGMIKRLKSEILNPKYETKSKSKNRNLKVVATGGLAPLICKYTKVVDRIDNNLTLKGLRIIAEKLIGTCD